MFLLPSVHRAHYAQKHLLALANSTGTGSRFILASSTTAITGQAVPATVERDIAVSRNCELIRGRSLDLLGPECNLEILSLRSEAEKDNEMRDC
jgi:hypothetical protein